MTDHLLSSGRLRLMETRLTEADLALLREPQIGILATAMADATPQLTPVWVDTDGEAVLVNTAKGRVKHRNLVRQPVASVCVVDRADAHRWVAVRGRVELISEGAREHADVLARKYGGPDATFPHVEGVERVIVRILPEHRRGEP
jgi:PPOX class probable F420-dependent enzyme